MYSIHTTTNSKNCMYVRMYVCTYDKHTYSVTYIRTTQYIYIRTYFHMLHIIRTYVYVCMYVRIYSNLNTKHSSVNNSHPFFFIFFFLLYHLFLFTRTYQCTYICICSAHTHLQYNLTITTALGYKAEGNRRVEVFKILTSSQPKHQM